MARGRLVYEVTIWEFRRWYKIRDQVTTLVLSLVIGLAVWGGITLLTRNAARPVTIAVQGREVLPFPAPPSGRITLAPNEGRSENALRQAVDAEEIDGLLIIETADRAALVVKKEPNWLPELQATLTEARRARGLGNLGISSVQLADALAPYDVAVSYTASASGPTSGPVRTTGVVILVLMLVGVMMGLALQFVAITGEKQTRVTEQVVSAITAQTWIDGKILGISLVALATLATYLVSIVMFLAMSWVVGRNIPIPLGVVGPAVWLVLLPLAVLGFLFWNTAFAAVAATIDDPNTSARGGLMMLPFLTMGVAFLRIGNPEGALTQFLAIFPLTSPAFLTLRLMLTPVPVWEILLALILLLGAVAFMRRAAGKIFGMGILMYGKEPSWSEMVRWLRSA
jgi:ABC-2 type transport system permease protein